MVNVNELKAAIVRKGLTQKEVADKMTISPRTFTSRLNKGVFGSDEIEQLMDILDINDPISIFFAQAVT